MSDVRLIVGLGNPGKKYEQTRHNLGAMVVRRLAKRLELEFSKGLFLKSVSTQGRIKNKLFFLMLPLTYMNHSGVAIKQFIAKKKIALENMLVVYDELDLDFGQLRLRTKGSDGGHNGLGSVISQLKTQDFARLRVGIKSPEPRSQDTVDYVLEEFNASQKEQLDDIIEHAVDCCTGWLTQGMNKVMTEYNKRIQDE